MTHPADENLNQINKQILLLKRQQKALEARDDFMSFVKFTMPDPEDPNDVERSLYDNARHHDAIAAAVEEVEKGNYQFLILTTPPRHGKSELVSRRLPAWHMGRHPDQSVVVVTYNGDFAKDSAANVRSIMHTPQYRHVFPEVKLARGGSSKNRIETTQGGMATFVGVGGSLTGRGAHLLIIDDLIKSYEEARSQSYRDRAWEWFTKVAMTRRMGQKAVIITFTRWHQDDIIGRLTDPENEYYNRGLAERIKVINLPAIAEDDDPLGREQGEALWPDWYGLDFLNEQRELDPLGFESLYQQRPSVADGTLFRRENVQYYDPESIDVNDMRIYCASDHAVSTKQRANPTCLLRVGVDKNNHIYLLDCWWKRSRADEVVEAMLMMGSDHPRPLNWWAERGHISGSIGPFLRKRMVETGRFFNITEVTPAADKEQRAQSISARMSMGYVWWPKGRPWVEKAINQCLAFPNGKEDDFVDAFAYIGLGLQNLFPSGTREQKKQPRSGTLGWLKQQMKEQEAAKASTGSFA